MLSYSSVTNLRGAWNNYITLRIVFQTCRLAAFLPLLYKRITRTKRVHQRSLKFLSTAVVSDDKQHIKTD